MEFKQGIYWHQGLFLQPQHFQLLELQNQYAKKQLCDLTTPYCFGVGHIQFSLEALNTRSFHVRAANLIFQDQTFIEFPGNAVICPRSFEKNWTNSDQPLDVYLGLKKMSVVAPNVTVLHSLDLAASADTRMVSLSDAQEFPDLYSAGPEAAIPTVQYSVQIFFQSELNSLDNYDLIHVARLTRDSDGIKTVPQYIPPCYNIAGSSMLSEIIKDIRDDMVGRLRQLEDYKIPREIQQQDLDPDYFVLLQVVQTLNRLVPAIFHQTETNQAHPWNVYGLLRVIIGEISTFSENVDVFGKRKGSSEGLPAYDHLNLGPCFAAARILINQLLNQISVGPEFLAIMEERGDYLAATLPKNFFATRNRFYLIIQTNSNKNYSVDDFHRSARLGALSEMPNLIKHALPGIDLIDIATAPQGLPRRANSRYYRIEQMSAGWELVEQESDLALFWPDAPADLRAEIVVLKG
jgi:type VI secretion system protein ImpJ